MKKIIALFALSMIISTNSFAKPNQAVIGIVDLAKIQSEAKIYKDIAKERDNFVKSIQPEIAAKEKVFKEEADKLEKEKSKLSEDKFKEKLTAFLKKTETAKAEIQKETLEFNKIIEDTVVNVAKTALQPTINEVASKNEVNLVFDKRQVVFFADGMDLTDEIISILNKKFPKAEIKKSKKVPAKKKR